MLTLLQKEISGFLNSLIGYIVIIIFLLVTGLFIWGFESGSNILDNGFSTIQPLFVMAPWVFLFLIPAITMRSFADEKRSGTIELLLTRPLSDLQIVLAKFFAGFFLVLISLLPTLIYFYSVYKLGQPVGNIDTGATWGSYFGLLFLGGAYVAIGIFASSLTDNQIISFIIAVSLSAFFCYGFDLISTFSFLSKIDNVIINLGITSHYASMSRGVLDTRDLVYFLSLIALFIVLTKTVLESRKW
jgi:ABC-2 type transport system permease protein